MKKIVTISTLMLLILSLVGCMRSKPNATTSINEAADVTTTSTPDNSKEITTQETADIMSVPVVTEETTVQIPENPNFRNTVWGMTKEEVKQIEGLSSLSLTEDGTDYIAYEKDQIVGLPAAVVYCFDDDQKLWRGAYNFSGIEHTNKNLYIDDYYALVDGLTKVYGSPIYNEPYWSDDLYKDDLEDWGFAVSLGDVSFEAEWKTPETDIWISLSGDNYKIKLAIYYDSLTYERVNIASTAGL